MPEASVSKRNGFSRSAKASTGAVMHFFFRVLKASFASGVKVTGVFFNLAFSHPVIAVKGSAMQA